jgi:hypothetical protein
MALARHVHNLVALRTVPLRAFNTRRLGDERVVKREVGGRDQEPATNFCTSIVGLSGPCIKMPRAPRDSTAIPSSDGLSTVVTTSET